MNETDPEVNEWCSKRYSAANRAAEFSARMIRDARPNMESVEQQRKYLLGRAVSLALGGEADASERVIKVAKAFPYTDYCARLLYLDAVSETELESLLDDVRTIRDTTTNPRTRQAADLILRDAALTPAEREALYGPGRMHEQALPIPVPRWVEGGDS